MLVGRGIGAAPTASIEAGTLSLTHLNGTDTSTTFVDQVSGVTWATDTGTPELDTTNKKFGSASLLCLRTGGVNESIKSSALTIDETGDWTIEGWFFLTSSGRGAIQIYESTGLFQKAKLVASLDGNNYIGARVGTTGEDNIVNYDNVSAGLSASTWYHWAIVRDVTAGTYSFFFNGDRLDVVSTATDSGELSIIRLQDEGTSNGHGIQHDEVRFIEAAKYSGATYSVPTEAFSG